MCGDEPTSPAETMVKNSSSEALVSGALGGMCGIFDWEIVPPSCILRAMRTRRSNAAARAFSFTSLVEMTTSERMEGMKCREEAGRCSVTTAMASSRSRRHGADAVETEVRRRSWSSELRSCRARVPAGDVARRGSILYAFFWSCGSAARGRMRPASEKRSGKVDRGR